MPRIRTIKPSFTRDEELSSLPAETHLFSAGLLTSADDEGYFSAHPGLLKADIFPLRESSLSVPEMLTQLTNIGFIRLGTAADGKSYGHIVRFTEHQRVNRPTPSRIKPLQIVWADSLSTHGALTEDSGGKGKERNKEGNKEGSAHARPTLAQVRAYCAERGNVVDPERWFNHYTANGWRVGRVPMKDWKAAIRNWETNGNGNGNGHKTNAKQYVEQKLRALGAADVGSAESGPELLPAKQARAVND